MMSGHRSKSEKHDVDGGGDEKQLRWDPYEVLGVLHELGNQNRVPQNGAQVRFNSLLAVLLCIFFFLNLRC